MTKFLHSEFHDYNKLDKVGLDFSEFSQKFDKYDNKNKNSSLIYGIFLEDQQDLREIREILTNFKKSRLCKKEEDCKEILDILKHPLNTDSHNNSSLCRFSDKNKTRKFIRLKGNVLINNNSNNCNSTYLNSHLENHSENEFSGLSYSSTPVRLKSNLLKRIALDFNFI